MDIAPISTFGEGESRLVEIDNTWIAVFNIDGDYFAMEDLCTHDGSPLLGCEPEPKGIIEGDNIVCPRHGARFSIRTGEALTPPAYEPICTFPVRINDGMVQVQDSRND